jgi:hypothetical protein
MDLKQDPKNFRYLLRLLKLENNALNAISTIINIIENIINFPNEEKYKSIRFNNKSFTENIIKVKGSLDLLICLGFIKKIKDHQEFLILQNTNNIQMCILKDYLEELKMLVPSLPKPRQDQSQFTTFSQIKEMKKQKQEYIDLLIRQAEEDRLIKLEKESKNVEKLLKYQREKSKENKEKMENLRNKMNFY